MPVDKRHVESLLDGIEFVEEKWVLDRDSSAVGDDYIDLVEREHLIGRHALRVLEIPVPER